MKNKILDIVAIAFILFVVFLSFSANGDTTSTIDSAVVLTGDTLQVVTPVQSESNSIFSLENLLIVLTGLYEIAVRIYPTTKDFSIISFIHKMINFLLPNFRKEGGRH